MRLHPGMEPTADLQEFDTGMAIAATRPNRHRGDGSDQGWLTVPMDSLSRFCGDRRKVLSWDWWGRPNTADLWFVRRVSRQAGAGVTVDHLPVLLAAANERLRHPYPAPGYHSGIVAM
jgi:hypothetical protein